MEDLNNVPSSGTFGAAINEVNANFSLIVNAINSLEYSLTKSKGILNYGTNPATEFPNATEGDWCMILSDGNVFPATIKTFNGTSWTGSGQWSPSGIDLTGYATTEALSTAVANSLLQATARMGYGEATANNNAYSVTIANYTLPTNGGVVRVKMPTAATGAATLDITNTGAKTIWYNGKAVSSTNTWEAEEIISVFYDGTKYMASNSQGGGGKADMIKYDNSQSELAATDVQNAIDEIKETVTSLETEVYGAKSTVEYTNQAQGFIKSNGYANTTTSNYSYTNLIDVSSYGKIDITRFFASSTTLAIAAYKDGTESVGIASQVAIVSKSVVGNGAAARSYKIPYGIRYIRLSYERTKTAAPVITGYAKTTVNELVQQTTELDERVDVLEKNEITTVVPLVAELSGMCYYNGGLTTVSGAMCRKYDVEGIETLSVTTRFNAGSSGFYLAIFVDSNETVVEQQYVIPSGSTAVVTDEPFSVPSGAKYVYVNSRGNTSLPKVKTYDKIDARIKAQSGGKYISILFVGNSLTQDAVSYVPLLLKELAPSLNFKLYIFYNGGKTLADQYTIITNDTACEIYSECVNKTSWTNYDRTKTMSQIISSIQFDVLCLQEYYNYAAQNISAYNNIVDWFMTNYSYPFKLITLFHAPLRSSATTVFNRTLDGIKNILKTTPTEGIIPAGIAIYRALSSDLSSLGDKGGLSPDGTHAQEGLPCMLEAYVTALWILQEMAIPAGVLRANTIVTRDNYLSINVPGPNYGSGCVVGTAEQVRLSQVIATKAWKEGLSILGANQTEYTD